MSPRKTIDVSDLRPGPLRVRSAEAPGVARSKSSAEGLKKLAEATAERALASERRRQS